MKTFIGQTALAGFIWISGLTVTGNGFWLTPFEFHRTVHALETESTEPKSAIEVPVGVDQNSPPDGSQYLKVLSDLAIVLEVDRLVAIRKNDELSVSMVGKGSGSNYNFILFAQDNEIVHETTFPGFPQGKNDFPSKMNVLIPMSKFKRGEILILVGYREHLGGRNIVTAKSRVQFSQPTRPPERQVEKIDPEEKRVVQPKKKRHQ